MKGKLGGLISLSGFVPPVDIKSIGDEKKNVPIFRYAVTIKYLVFMEDKIDVSLTQNMQQRL